MKLAGENNFTKNLLVELKKALTDNLSMHDDFTSLRKILEIIKIYPKWLWYYNIPNVTGLFNLQGKNKLVKPYLNLGIEHPCLNPEVLFEFHLDLDSKGVSLLTNNDFLRIKTYELIDDLYTEKYYDPICRYPLNILGQIYFRKEHFSNEIIRELQRTRM